MVESSSPARCRGGVTGVDPRPTRCSQVSAGVPERGAVAAAATNSPVRLAQVPGRRFQDQGLPLGFSSKVDTVLPRRREVARTPLAGGIPATPRHHDGDQLSSV